MVRCEKEKIIQDQKGKTKKECMVNFTFIFDEAYSYVQTLESNWLFSS